MDLQSFVMILGIMFWALAALAIVCLITWIWIKVQYYHWNKDDRIVDDLSQRIVDKINEAKEEMVGEI